MSIPGYFIYKDITILQNKNIPIFFTELIKKYKPKRVLEIGTASGGLTLLLRDILDENECSETLFKTYDIDNGDWSRSDIFIEAIKTRKIESILENIFAEDYSEILNKDCIDYIQGNGTTLVLCDGGNKVGEFNIISKYIKSGDIIMAHDYAISRDVFQKETQHKYWNYCEIVESDIADSVAKYSLIEVLDSRFHQVGWTCKIKQ